MTARMRRRFIDLLRDAASRLACTFDRVQEQVFDAARFRQTLALAQLCERPEPDEAPLEHESQAVTVGGFLQVMSGHERGDALARQIMYETPEAMAGQRIDARGRLIEKQHARAMHDAAREREPLADGTRNGVDLAVAEALQPCRLHRPSQCRSCARAVRSSYTPAKNSRFSITVRSG